LTVLFHALSPVQTQHTSLVLVRFVRPEGRHAIIEVSSHFTFELSMLIHLSPIFAIHPLLHFVGLPCANIMCIQPCHYTCCVPYQL